MKRILASSLCLSLILSCEQQPLNFISNDSEAIKDSVLASAAVSSTFVKNYGGTGSEKGKSVIRTSDGGYAIIGSSDGDFYLVKTDANGNSQWQKKYGDSSITENGNDLRQTSDGGFILIGTAGNYAKVVKTSSNGTMQWQTNVNNVQAGMGIALSNDNGYVGTGWGSFNNVTKAAVFKLSSNGSLLWLKSYGSVSTYGNSIERTSDNGFIVAGKTMISSNNSDVYLFKTNSQGDLQWQKNWGGDYSDGGNHAIQTSDGGYAVVGYDGKGATKSNVYLIKTNSQGTFQWIKGYFPSDGASGYALQQLSDRSYAIAAWVYTKATLLKVSSNGTYKWRNEFDDDVLENAADLVIASDGGYVITGQVNSGSLNEQAALVKTDKNGNLGATAVASGF